MQFAENVGQGAVHQDQAIAELSETIVEAGERLIEEGEVNGVKIGCLQHIRFVDEQAQARPASRSGGQCCVIGGAQVAAEPDNLQCHGGRSRSKGQESGSFEIARS